MMRACDALFCDSFSRLISDPKGRRRARGAGKERTCQLVMSAWSDGGSRQIRSPAASRNIYEQQTDRGKPDPEEGSKREGVRERGSGTKGLEVRIRKVTGRQVGARVT